MELQCEKWWIYANYDLPTIHKARRRVATGARKGDPDVQIHDEEKEEGRSNSKPLKSTPAKLLLRILREDNSRCLSQMWNKPMQSAATRYRPRPTVFLQLDERRKSVGDFFSGIGQKAAH